MTNLLARFKRLFRLRFAVLYPLGLYLAVFTTPSDLSTVIGGFFMVLGMFMRLWSNGYAIKMDKLTTSGPYAHVRNPLYVGTTLIFIGVLVMLQALWVGLAAFVVLGIVYTRTIRNEQKMLTDKFGQAFVDYCAKVPAMWPTFVPYAAGDKWPFSWRRVWDSREHKVVLWLGVVVTLFHLKKEWIVENGHVNTEMVVLILQACGLALVDLLSEYFRYRQKKGQ
jgi:protein-S-isoprenylcysteine O-methyltransferase Ste14